ncbi:hypothetical protein LTS08_004403 [Lithohypha guttulata]|uniref:uncharacterized protein n=1 Tax=Lithohypha guttulata TaxID=1690604 RepID=UPI002DE14D81|nr:hypothetical protein LTR51_007633 [Lithohypha guttulata]KAK5101944.1 hypothetical protein LTS08_004403 [Lithohypha guttulata]
MSTTKGNHTVLVSVTAGAAAGATETLCTYPAEFVKTYRQLPRAPSTAVFTGSVASAEPKTSLQVLRDTIRSSGIRGLYSGCSALVLSNAAKGGIRFISFTQSQAFFQKSKIGSANPGASTVLAGLTAGVVESVLVVTPGEALKTRMIHSRSLADKSKSGLKNPTLVQAAVNVVRTDGVRALWSGLGPVLCKQGTNSAVRFATFGLIQEKIRTSWGITGASATVMAGAASGVVTTYASMPFDNIKTRMQSLGTEKSMGMSRLALSMLKTEGIQVFWRATTPRLVRLTMSSSITFTVFDQVVALAAWLKKHKSPPVLVVKEGGNPTVEC